MSSPGTARAESPRPGPAGPEMADDLELMERVRIGDEAAYRAIIERHINRMVRLASRVLGDTHLAEDVVQDAFVQLWVKREEWKQTAAQLSTWLYRVVMNRCLDLKRRRREVGMEGEDTRPDESPDAVTSIHRGELTGALRGALNTLPEQQYAAIILYYHEGCSAREIAGILGGGVNAVESLLKRARQNLREKLRKWRSKADGSVFES